MSNTIRIDKSGMPPSAEIGDFLKFTATAQICGINAELVDITRYGGVQEYLLGSQTYDLLVTKVKFEEAG